MIDDRPAAGECLINQRAAPHGDPEQFAAELLLVAVAHGPMQCILLVKMVQHITQVRRRVFLMAAIQKRSVARSCISEFVLGSSGTRIWGLVPSTLAAQSRGAPLRSHTTRSTRAAC